MLLLQACNTSTPTGNQGNFITGYITFVDSNFTQGGGRYTIALYNFEFPPFASKPAKTEYLRMEKKDLASYKIYWDGDRRFYIAVAWVSSEDTARKPLVLGTLGCDTNHHCGKHVLIYFPNYGSNYNFMSWADTAQKLF